ncbi:FolM Alternative dihydrofolate reductase 1 [Rubrivivax sp. A210]|uniref:SDR family oxidoreductase n=1 Tax=Rubrivivax sp. A210 TaxID=2772301 RepID=UPI0019199C87|nr:SDR family oxidoreductase [Rubrivivax sp. A210]CAD5374190.1 FolM Alternative dihydrofolate reductase 1 [Rubrivivax sp. A210]
METRPVALVTGAARRIGRAIALELAAHGWAVAVHARHAVEEGAETVALIEAAGGRALAFAAELADEAQCEALVPAVLAAFGRVDAVVNNASVFEYDDVFSFGHAAMEAAWRINTAPAIILARGLHAAVGAGSGRGVVVNLLDQKLAHPHPDHLSYTLSKVALQGATTMLAQALAPRLRVCAVAPGVTLNSGNMTDAEFAAAHRMTPLQRSSSVEDVARAVCFLVEASAITGVTLMVDGGQHLLAQARDVMFLAREPQHPEKSP